MSAAVPARRGQLRRWNEGPENASAVRSPFASRAASLRALLDDAALREAAAQDVHQVDDLATRLALLFRGAHHVALASILLLGELAQRLMRIAELADAELLLLQRGHRAPDLVHRARIGTDTLGQRHVRTGAHLVREAQRLGAQQPALGEDR